MNQMHSTMSRSELYAFILGNIPSIYCSYHNSCKPKLGYIQWAGRTDHKMKLPKKCYCWPTRYHRNVDRIHAHSTWAQQRYLHFGSVMHFEMNNLFIIPCHSNTSQALVKCIEMQAKYFHSCHTEHSDCRQIHVRVFHSIKTEKSWRTEICAVIVCIQLL